MHTVGQTELRVLSIQLLLQCIKNDILIIKDSLLQYTLHTNYMCVIHVTHMHMHTYKTTCKSGTKDLKANNTPSTPSTQIKKKRTREQRIKYLYFFKGLIQLQGSKADKALKPQPQITVIRKINEWIEVSENAFLWQSVVIINSSHTMW